MKRIPSWLSYSVLRVAFLAVPFAILMAVGLNWLLAIFAASALSLVLSLVFLRRPREATSIAIALAQERRQQQPASVDDAREDAEIAEQMSDASSDA